MHPIARVSLHTHTHCIFILLNAHKPSHTHIHPYTHIHIHTHTYTHTQTRPPPHTYTQLPQWVPVLPPITSWLPRKHSHKSPDRRTRHDTKHCIFFKITCFQLPIELSNFQILKIYWNIRPSLSLRLPFTFSLFLYMNTIENKKEKIANEVLNCKKNDIAKCERNRLNFRF